MTRGSVFLNVPFDEAYEGLFCALVSTVVGLGLRPHCVLEVPAGPRLERLTSVMSECGVSIHELSRIETSRGLPRFNMPFELGLALGRARWASAHTVFVLESRPYRLQKTLSDLNGLDPRLHGGTIRGMVRAVLDCLGRPADTQEETRLQALAGEVRLATRRWKRQQRRPTIFGRTGFERLVAVATARAEQAGLPRSR